MQPWDLRKKSHKADVEVEAQSQKAFPPHSHAGRMVAHDRHSESCLFIEGDRSLS